jgi:hypothetical protein
MSEIVAIDTTMTLKGQPQAVTEFFVRLGYVFKLPREI